MYKNVRKEKKCLKCAENVCQCIHTCVCVFRAHIKNKFSTNIKKVEKQLSFKIIIIVMMMIVKTVLLTRTSVKKKKKKL